MANYEERSQGGDLIVHVKLMRDSIGEGSSIRGANVSACFVKFNSFQLRVKVQVHKGQVGGTTQR